MQSALLFSYTIIGDPGVGKTCLEQQFTDGTFPEVHEPTIGVEFGTRTLAVDDKRINLYIWDTPGHESFTSIVKQYYYRAACIILVYDVTRRETFDHIAIWLERARNQSRAGVTLVLIGNKCDLSHMRAVGYEEGQKFAKNHNLVFMEASAKTAQNVEEIMSFTPRGSGGVARSSCEGRNCCLVWCQKIDLPICRQANKLATGRLATSLLCQPLETCQILASFGVANMLASQFLAVNQACSDELMAQNGAMEADEAERSQCSV